MATPVQQNLESKNKEYASDFKHKDLTLPPAKKYAIGMSSCPFLRIDVVARAQSHFVTVTG
jgi:hypothetical protein